MKCDQYLAYLESNNLFKKILARRHARGCPDCREAHSTFQNIKKTLSVSESLTTQQKKLWLNVVQSETVETSESGRRANFKIASGLIVTACILLGLFIVSQNPEEKQEVKQITENPKPVQPKEKTIVPHKKEKAKTELGVTHVSEIEEVTFNVDFSDLKQEIAELEREIDTQMIHAQLIDVQKQVEKLLAENQN